MRSARENPDFDPEIGLPQGLREALREAAPLPAAMRVDEAIAAAAKRKLRPAMRLRARLVQLGGLAAAASILIAIFASPRGQPTARSASGADSVARDVNRDGRIDIRDALLLARRIEDGGALVSSWDFTGDAVVDRRDVDAVALASVRLDRRGL